MAKRKKLTPTFGMVMHIPEPFLNTARTTKMHEKAVRRAIEETLFKHWRGRFRDHFKATARSRYDHIPRSRPYMKKKKEDFRSVTDSVKTSRLKHHTTTARPRFSVAKGDFGDMVPGARRGSTSGLGTTGRLTMSFPYSASTKGGNRKDGMKKVTPSVIAAELGRFTSDEMFRAANYYILRYEKHILTELASSPTLVKRYQGDIGKFGPVATK